jgi:hypothetical protein
VRLFWAREIRDEVDILSGDLVRGVLVNRLLDWNCRRIPVLALHLVVFRAVRVIEWRVDLVRWVAIFYVGYV